MPIEPTITWDGDEALWVITGRPPNDRPLGRVYRSIEHKPHAPIGGFDLNIRGFSNSVLSLQEARQTADDDPGPRFHTSDASKSIETARSAQTDWQTSANERRDGFLRLPLFRPRQ